MMHVQFLLSSLIIIILLLAALTPSSVAFLLPTTRRRSHGSSIQLPTHLEPKNIIQQTIPQQHGQFLPTTLSRAQTSRKPVLKSSTNGGEDGTNNNNPDDGRSSSNIAAILPVVVPLLLVYISNQWSRSSIYYLVDFTTSTTNNIFTAMNQDIGFDEAQYGALASIAFTALFAIASLFAGGLADRYDRKVLTVGSALVWSLATWITAQSVEYEQVLAARVVMGLACAFTTTSGYTLIRDLVPNERASLANSLYGSGVYLGGGLSSLSILLDGKIGWRGTMELIAAFGFCAAVLSAISIKGDPKMLLLSDQQLEDDDNDVTIDTKIDVVGSSSSSRDDDDQANNDEGKKQSPFSDVTEILSIPRVQWLFAGSFLRFCSGLCIGVWAAAYYKLAFPDDAASYAVINAFIVGLCGVTSGLIGGYAADKTAALMEEQGLLFFEKSSSAGRLVVPIVGSLLAVPAWWMTVHASDFDSAMIWLAVEYLVAECWFGPTVAVLQSEVGTRQGGTAQGLFNLAGAIGNLAPSILGILYGQQQQISAAAVVDVNSSSSSSALLLSGLLGNGVCIGYFLSAVCFVVSAIQKEDSGKENTFLKQA